MTERKSAFTASEDRNTAATSGSRTTASAPSVIFWSEPVGFGSPVVEPVLLPHRITGSLTLLRIRRFLHSLHAQRCRFSGTDDPNSSIANCERDQDQSTLYRVSDDDFAGFEAARDAEWVEQLERAIAAGQVPLRANTKKLDNSSDGYIR